MSPPFLYKLLNGGEYKGIWFKDPINLICDVDIVSWKEMPYVEENYTYWPSEAAWMEAAYYRGDSAGYQFLYVDSDEGIASLKSLSASGNLAIPQSMHTFFEFTDNDVLERDGLGKRGGWLLLDFIGNYESSAELVCFFEDRIGYEPSLLAKFQNRHPIRTKYQLPLAWELPALRLQPKSSAISKCTVILSHRYAFWQSPSFSPNKIVLDISGFQEHMSSMYHQPFFLMVNDGYSPTLGNITHFSIQDVTCNQTPSKPGTMTTCI